LGLPGSFVPGDSSAGFLSAWIARVIVQDGFVLKRSAINSSKRLSAAPSPFYSVLIDSILPAAVSNDSLTKTSILKYSVSAFLPKSPARQPGSWVTAIFSIEKNFHPFTDSLFIKSAKERIAESKEPSEPITILLGAGTHL
jgi:hypothetical protein